jgi:putative membrane protein
MRTRRCAVGAWLLGIGMTLVALAVSGWLAPSSFAGPRQEVSPDQTFAQKAVVGGVAEVPRGKLAVKHAAAGQREASPDQMFAQKAAAGGVAEVQLGKLAVERAASPDVKQLGQRMVTDHEKGNRELMAVVEKKGLSMPTAPDPKQQEEATRLATLQGAAFDRAYLQQMVQDHEEDVSLFRTQATEGQDPELKSFAAKTLPTLEEHLKLVRDLAKKQP